MLADGKNKILVNLAGVAFMDSGSVGELVSGHVRATNDHGCLKLLNPEKRVRDSLAFTRLDTVFEVYDNEIAAVQSFCK